MANPRLSIIVIFYNMRREAARTLHTLSAEYQRGVSADDYEIIAIDNGSPDPLRTEDVEKFGDNFRFIDFNPDGPSPAKAVNHGVKSAQSDHVAVIVDGARMVSPGIIRATIDALLDDKPFVTTLAWHLGPDVQNKSMQRGYNQVFEDAMLAGTGWEDDGYRLFAVSILAQSSKLGLGGGFPHECSWFAMGRAHYLAMGGYDARFQSPGGGLVNHEFVQRLFSDDIVQARVLMGEGSFHQYHGGIATNATEASHPWPVFAAEYVEIFGEDYDPQRPLPTPLYVGRVHPLATRFVSGTLSADIF